jgi:hypothetical protein
VQLVRYLEPLFSKTKSYCRADQLSETGWRFRNADDYAVQAQRIAEASETEDDEFRDKILADSYRFQGIIGSCLETSKGVEYTKKWVELLLYRIQKYQLKDDLDTLSMAYHEYGRALMRIPHRKEALRSWDITGATIRERTKAEDLRFLFLWFHRALVYGLDGEGGIAESITLPVLEEREKKLGKSDTNIYE